MRRRRATKLGASLLEKPVHMADLLAEVKELLSSSRNLAEPSLPAEHKEGPGSTGTPQS
jgi:DNA-binding response OmpR family regulator